MTTAQRITKRSKDSIYSVVSDEHNVICHTEATLDTWWNSLAPEDKAALYELHLEGAAETPLADYKKRVMQFTNAIAGQPPAKGVKAHG